MIDHDILRAITGAQAKVPTEMLYLETAQVPIKSVIIGRRLLYLQTILHRHKSELTRRIYDAMKEEPLKDDWIHLVTKDMSDINLNLSDDQISKLSKSEFKILVKSKMRNSAYVEFERVKQGHSKVKHISHIGLKKSQPYLKDARFSNKETSLLFNLRSQCVNEFKANFYTSTCQFCKLHLDTQEHALSCNMFRKHMKKEHLQVLDSVTYNDLFSDSSSQLTITKVFLTIINTRELLRTPTMTQAYPGHRTGPVASTN